jgi:O-antigen ligase
MTILSLAIFTALFAILAWKRLDWALLLLIASLPAYLIRFKILGLPATLLELMILISFMVWLIKDFIPRYKTFFSNPKGRIPYPFSWEIILVLIISWSAVWVAGFNASALGIWKAYFFEPILLFILIFNVFKSWTEARKILWSLLLSAAAVSIFAIFQKLTGLFISNPFWAAEGTRRAVSFFGYPNAVGLYLAPLTMLFSGWLLSYDWQNARSRYLEKSLIVLTILSSLLAIYSARSEGALIGIIAALFAFGLLAGRKQRLAVIIFGVVIIAGTFLSAPTKDFIFTKLSLRDLSGQIRLQQWRETWQMLGDGKLVSGTGLSQYQSAIKPFHQEGIFFNRDNLPNFGTITYASSTLRAKYWQPVEIYMYPHNIFLNFWTELGIFGALLFIWLIARYLLTALRLTNELRAKDSRNRYLTLGLLSAMIAIVVHGLVDVPYFKNDLSAMFWILFALLGILNISRHRKDAPEAIN